MSNRGTFPVQGKSPADRVGLSLCRESLLQSAWDFPCVGKVSCRSRGTFPVQGKSPATCVGLSLCRESLLQPCVGLALLRANIELTHFINIME